MRTRPQLSLLTAGVTVATLLLASTTTLAGNYKAENYKGEAMAPCPVELVLRDGFYLGAAVGYDVYRLKNDVDAVFLPAGTTSISDQNKLNAGGWVGGGFLGWGKYFDNFYIAAEIFGNGSDAEGSRSHTYTSPAIVGGVSSSSVQYQVQDNYGISVLPGWRLNPATLFYVRLGYNWSQIDADETVTINGVTTKNNGDGQTGHGFNYGVGIEAAFWDCWSLRAEYTRTDYDRLNASITTADIAFSESVKPADNQFMLGLIYHFA